MKDVLVAAMILLVISGAACAIGTPGTPHPVYVGVDNKDGLTPADGDLVFDSWIVGRETEILTETSVGCGYSGGLISVECGNFATAWSAGELLVIAAEQSSTGYSATAGYTLTNDNLQFFSGQCGMTLVPEPAMMCLLGLGGLMIRKRK